MIEGTILGLRSILASLASYILFGKLDCFAGSQIRKLHNKTNLLISSKEEASEELTNHQNKASGSCICILEIH
jgi:hypothetical protein